MWCPSHCGIRGNEDVDQAARNPADPDQLMLCSPDDFKPLAASLVKKEWQDQWNLVPITNKLKSIKPIITNWDTSNQENRIKELLPEDFQDYNVREATHKQVFFNGEQLLPEDFQDYNVREATHKQVFFNGEQLLPEDFQDYNVREATHKQVFFNGEQLLPEDFQDYNVREATHKQVFFNGEQLLPEDFQDYNVREATHKQENKQEKQQQQNAKSGKEETDKKPDL
ncbi:hypothetical protein M8J77_012878 [Diaphorina citri]|nr:hypothetical protein M8J77_012878 [Diaphorina citri]